MEVFLFCLFSFVILQVQSQSCSNWVQTSVCDYTSVLSGNGGCQGSVYTFQSPTCSSSVEKLECWTRVGDGARRFIRGLRLELFDGSTRTLGDVSGTSTESIEFESTDRIVSNIAIGRYTSNSGAVVKLGSLHFQTTTGKTFSCGTRSNETVHACVDCYLVGFFGRVSTSDVDSLGVLAANRVGKSAISNGVITDLTYPDLQLLDLGAPTRKLSSSLCNDANVTQTLTQKYLKSKGSGRTVTKIDGKEYSNGFQTSIKISVEKTIGPEIAAVKKGGSLEVSGGGTWGVRREDTTSELTTKEEMEVSEMSVAVPARTRALANFIWYEKRERFYFTGIFEFRFAAYKSVLRFPIEGLSTETVTSPLEGVWSFQKLKPTESCIDLRNLV